MFIRFTMRFFRARLSIIVCILLSLLVLRVGSGIWLYKFLMFALLFTFFYHEFELFYWLMIIFVINQRWDYFLLTCLHDFKANGSLMLKVFFSFRRESVMQDDLLHKCIHFWMIFAFLGVLYALNLCLVHLYKWNNLPGNNFECWRIL